MSGDYSRITFDPWDDDLGVLLQQGRPLSDAEWNALALQLRRRIHAGMLDTVGAAVVPRQTADGFRIGLLGGNLRIAPGRIYVDGILAQNHGLKPLQWDARLEEQTGIQPVIYRAQANQPQTAQPYLPNAPEIPIDGRHLVYLDVWTREVDALMRPDLIEKAVGVDSTTRLQTVWQVKVLPNVGQVNCSTPLAQIPGWLPAHAPSAGRLSSTTAAVAGEPDPCLVPPGGGYKGLENQLYRVEIQRGGAPGTATFKWSRDNASVQTRVSHIPALNQLTVESTGRDAVLRFSDGDWIEILDDWLELNNQPGELRRIKIGNGVDDATRTILLEKPLPAGLFPTDGQHRTQPGRHTRIRRWDQRGKVLDSNGNVLQDLDSNAATGEITVPADATVRVLLEHGIVVSFNLAAGGGGFRSGDAWSFAARAVDATIEELESAPPRAIHHHYAKLALISADGSVSDCRILWPPEQQAAAGDCCDCTICVSPEQQQADPGRLQKAIDDIIAAGGGSLCLQAGIYTLDRPLQIAKARSLRVLGQGEATLLRAPGEICIVEDSADVTLQRFAAASESQQGSAVIVLRNVKGALLRELDLTARRGIALRLSRVIFEVTVEACTLQADLGVDSEGNPTNGGTSLHALRLRDNRFECGVTAIQLDQVSLSQSLLLIGGNRIEGCQKAAVVLTGAVAPGFRADIVGNSLHVLSDGLHLGVDGAQVLQNSLVSLGQETTETAVRLLPGLSGDDGIGDCRIAGNTVHGFRIGVDISANVANLAIEGNQFRQCMVGVHCANKFLLQRLAIQANQFTDLQLQALRMAMRGDDARRSSVAISDNQIQTRSVQHAVTVTCPLGDIRFSDNHCQQSEQGGEASVELTAHALIVASNRIEGKPKLSMLLRPAMEKEQPLMTVVGNIARGTIDTTSPGAGLPARWVPLNWINA